MSATRQMALIVGLVALALLFGCSSGGSAATETPSGGAAAADGAALVEKQCALCHTLDRVDSAIYDEATWTSTVERMEANGMVMSAEDKQAVIDYLTKRDASR